MIFNDDDTLTYQQRISETADYLKYCQHKTRKLDSDEQLYVLRQCLLDRLARTPDDNQQVLHSLKQYLGPNKTTPTYSTEYIGDLASLGLNIPTITSPEVEVPTITNNTNKEVKIDHTAADSQPLVPELDQTIEVKNNQQQKALHDIVSIFYDSSPSNSDNLDVAPDPQKVEEIIGTLLLLANHHGDAEYRLIDILPQLGDAFEAREEIIKNVLNETIETMFQLLDIDKFHDVKLKESLNSPLKRKAFLFDLLSQSFQRTKHQHQKGVYLEQALNLYHHKLKGLGIS